MSAKALATWWCTRRPLPPRVSLARAATSRPALVHHALAALASAAPASP
eukprot:CAMPEP_0183799476 /NCGR_PEP_ID=MMETSP0803_2-20130417/21737_1 /TAXON_ID=195967 /ORGANISM="Crustomastix stigmata, Strain CCMP3273" /LENGTH=48 /DNA_ID= /DNA_START= /DNA_END= /DNA_ORIENTATION=